MKTSKVPLLLAFILSFLVLLIVPIWFLIGVGGSTGHSQHAGEMVDAAWFTAMVNTQQKKFGLADGSVRLPPNSSIYVIAEQFAFTPAMIRVQAGGRYDLHFYSPDVLHGASLVQSGSSSLNTVIMPGMISATSIEVTHEGSILMLCNEYCGVGHYLMKGRIIVEGGESSPVPPQEPDSNKDMPGMGDHH